MLSLEWQRCSQLYEIPYRLYWVTVFFLIMKKTDSMDIQHDLTQLILQGAWMMFLQILHHPNLPTHYKNIFLLNTRPYLTKPFAFRCQNF